MTRPYRLTVQTAINQHICRSSLYFSHARLVLGDGAERTCDCTFGSLDTTEGARPSIRGSRREVWRVRPARFVKKVGDKSNM
jgi:hypothetical protein